jgi:hypothetical protein
VDEPPPALFHFSEQAGIARFEPRAPLERPEVEPMVWAIDEWHAPMYYLPRDCPRACFWAGPATSDQDRERWMAGSEARMVIAVELAWLERIRQVALYRYRMPPDGFVLHDHDGGHWVSRQPVMPLSVEPVGDLLAALARASVELRITPSLIGLWQRVVRSTLCFSGTRLRNARGWDPSLFDSARDPGTVPNGRGLARRCTISVAVECQIQARLV